MHTMKTLAFAALAMGSIAAPAMAQSWTSNRVGPFTYYNSDNGWTGTSNTIGPFTYHNFTGPNGQTTNCTTNTVGQFTYTNCY